MQYEKEKWKKKVIEEGIKLMILIKRKYIQKIGTLTTSKTKYINRINTISIRAADKKCPQYVETEDWSHPI